MAKETKGFFGKLVDSIKDSLIDERLEADLVRAGHGESSREYGEAVYFRHTQGHVSLRLKLDADIGVEAGEELDLVLDGTTLCKIPWTAQSIKESWSSKEGDSLPNVTPGVTVQLLHNGAPILEGEFEKD